MGKNWQEEYWAEQLATGLQAQGAAVPQQASLLAFLSLLRKWNSAYNLTAVRDAKIMVARQLLDSLSVLPWISAPAVLDVGSGGGMPGIPLAIALPDTHFTLLDSNGKKTRFLRQAVMELQLHNVDIVQARVEQWTPASGFGQITSRAFAALADVVRLTGHLLLPDGEWLAMTGPMDAESVAPLSGDYHVSVEPLSVPGEIAGRHLVRVTRAAR